MKKLINKIKQWRLVGYVILIIEFFKIHDEQQAIIESFLLVVLGELSARTGKTYSSPQEFQQENFGNANNDNSSHSSSIEEKK